MRLSTESVREMFVLMGSMKRCRVQRLDNFKAGNDDGYLRAHHLGTDHDQAHITADANTGRNTETNFYLGLFY